MSMCVLVSFNISHQSLWLQQASKNVGNYFQKKTIVEFFLSIHVKALCNVSMGILLELHIYISFLECTSPTNCPNGGTNYECNANVCVCPSPKVLDGDKCVGM